MSDLRELRHRLADLSVWTLHPDVHGRARSRLGVLMVDVLAAIRAVERASPSSVPDLLTESLDWKLRDLLRGTDDPANWGVSQDYANGWVAAINAVRAVLPSSGPDLRCLTCGAVIIDALAGGCHECGAVDRHIGSQWLRMPDEQRPLHREGLDIAYLSDGRPACPRCRMPLDGKDALEKFRPARKPVTGPKSEE